MRALSGFFQTLHPATRKMARCCFFIRMNDFLQLCFWLGLAIVAYAYVGYGLVLFMLVRLKKILFPPRLQVETTDQPEVTFVVCAFNEAAWMQRKIENCLAFAYPKDRITLCFVTDGSDDGTPDIVRNYPFPAGTRVQVLHESARNGKIAAFKRAMEHINTPIIISTDANTDVNPEAIQRIVRHFQDPQVGAVAGEKRISMGEKEAASSAGEGIYWKYESLLKRWDAELWSVVGAAGELFAIRKAVYEPVPSDTIVEDFYMTMRIAAKGYRVAYEPEAYAVEASSASVTEELKRKIRIAAGSWQAVVRLAALLNPFRYGVLCFQYVSHRVLRWTLAPALLPLLFIVNLILALQGFLFYQLIFALQLMFYAAALAGYVFARREIKIKIFFVPYYFCVMNYAQYAGFFRFLNGGQTVLWERVKRTGES